MTSKNFIAEEDQKAEGALTLEIEHQRTISRHLCLQLHAIFQKREGSVPIKGIDYRTH